MNSKTSQNLNPATPPALAGKIERRPLVPGGTAMTTALLSCGRRVALGAAAAALALGVPVGAAAPAQAAPRPACVDGSRDIRAQHAVDVARAALAGGTQGMAEITLRSTPDGSCHWALISGYGQVWLERAPAYGGTYDGFVNPRKNTRDGITHTAATVTTRHWVRACGLPFGGEVTSSNGFSLGAGAEGRSGSASISFNADDQVVYQYANGTVCTDWDTSHVLNPGY